MFQIDALRHQYLLNKKIAIVISQYMVTILVKRHETEFIARFYIQSLVLGQRANKINLRRRDPLWRPPILRIMKPPVWTNIYARAVPKDTCLKPQLSRTPRALCETSAYHDALHTYIIFAEPLARAGIVCLGCPQHRGAAAAA
jgi:hypothetical protein